MGSLPFAAGVTDCREGLGFIPAQRPSFLAPARRCYGAFNASFIAPNRIGSTPGATLDEFGPVS